MEGHRLVGHIYVVLLLFTWFVPMFTIRSVCCWAVMLCDGLSRFGKYQSPWWLGNYCLEFGVFEQNILRNLEHLSLGISSALKMDDKSCQGAEIWQNEDGYKNFPLGNIFFIKIGWTCRQCSTGIFLSIFRAENVQHWIFW